MPNKIPRDGYLTSESERYEFPTRGGVFMIVLKLVAAFSFTALLTGCILEDIKSDIKAGKERAALSTVPGQCDLPGIQEGPKKCKFLLLMTDPDPRDKAKGLVSAKIDPKVYEDNAKDCPIVNRNLLEQYKGLAYDCPALTLDFTKASPTYPDTEAEYTFFVEGHPKLEIGKTYEFESIPGSKHLRTTTP
jgi:hypothetical protein